MAGARLEYCAEWLAQGLFFAPEVDPYSITFFSPFSLIYR
jgi:hypothetical protein